MPTGTRTVKASPAETVDKLRMLLAAENCEIISASDSEIQFRHGTYLTQSAPLLPKRANVRLERSSKGTLLSYDIQVAKPVTVWLSLIAVVFCWLILPPIFVHRALVYHPQRFMENLLAGL